MMPYIMIALLSSIFIPLILGLSARVAILERRLDNIRAAATVACDPEGLSHTHFIHVIAEDDRHA